MLELSFTVSPAPRTSQRHEAIGDDVLTTVMIFTGAETLATEVNLMFVLQYLKYVCCHFIKCRGVRCKGNVLVFTHRWGDGAAVSPSGQARRSVKRHGVQERAVKLHR